MLPQLKSERSVNPNIFESDDQLNETIDILQTAPHKRSAEDLQKLHDQLKKLDFFANLWTKLSPETTTALLKQLRHEYAPRTKTIFSYGDPPTCFYLVLKGSVFVIAPKQTKKKGSANNIKTSENVEERSPHKLRRFSVIRLDSDTHKHLDNLREEDDIVTSEELANLYPDNFVLDIKRQGDKFGEAALNFGSTRTATIVSREHTHLITLHPSIYHQILSQYQETMFKDCVEFYQKAPLTADWPSENQIQLSYQSQTAHYQKNQSIYEIGDPCDYIYFIMEGEIELVKEARVDTFDDEVASKTAQSRHHLNIEKAKLSHVNAIWKQQYSKLKVQQITVAILGKYQAFGNEELAESLETRQTKAIVKSITAEILVVSYKNFVENKNNPRELCHKLMNIYNTPKNQWRQNFANQMIGMRLSNETNNEKTKSKFGQEFNDCISMLNKTNEDFAEPAPEREGHNRPGASLRRFSILNEISPANRLKSLEALQEVPSPSSPVSSLNVFKRKTVLTEPNETLSASNRKSSPSPSRKLVEVPVVTPSTLPLKGEKKKKFVNLIHPEAKEVRVVFNDKNKIAIDPSLVSVCLDLSPHSFQGSKVYQKHHVSALPDSVISPKHRHSTFMSMAARTDSIDISEDKSPIVKNLQERTASFVKLSLEATKGNNKANPFEKKLGELLSLKNKRLQKPIPENTYHSMFINSVFMSDSQSPRHFEEIAEVRQKGFLSPKSTSNRTQVHLPSISACYSPGLALPRTLPHKKSLRSHRNQK